MTVDLYAAIEQKGVWWLRLLRAFGAFIAVNVSRELYVAIMTGAIVLRRSGSPGPRYIPLDTPSEIAIGGLFLVLLLIVGAGVALAPRQMLRRAILVPLFVAILLLRAMVYFWFEAA